MTSVAFITLCVILMQSHGFAFKCIRETISPNEDNKGFIHSPNYPREYPPNVCFIWYHRVSVETKVVIKIQDLDIPSFDNCRSNTSNRLLIGPYDKRQYCGSLQSDIHYQTVVSDYFYIIFLISENLTPRGRGFLLQYELSTPGDPSELPTPKRLTITTMPPRHIEDKKMGHSCFFSMVDSYGIITIPKTILPSAHQYLYSDGEKSCSWLLRTPNFLGASRTSPIFRYALRFQHFHFFPDCCSLDIFEGSSDADGRLVGHYFSGSHPHSLYALGPQVFLKLMFNDYNYFGNFTIQFQREEICLNGYKTCSFNESGCYPSSKRCDGVWDCPLKGGDERGCTTSCSEHKFSCGNTSAYCYSEQDRCNGKGACANYRDEQDCSPSQCSSDKGLFLCQNKRCIYEKWRCDHTNDCEDGSDEDGCDKLSSPRLIIACVVGTLISSLLLVLALSFAIRVYTLRMRRRHGDLPTRHDSPLSRIEEDLLRRRAPPPQYNEAMMTSRSYDEAYLELLNQGQLNPPENSSLQEGGNNSNTPGTAPGSRRERGRRSGNRRRSGRDRRLHRNLRIQRQQQHLHGCPSLLSPPPLHYFTEQPPSYSDSTTGAAAELMLLSSSSSLLPSETDPSAYTSGDSRNHELQPMSSASTNTTTEPTPPPYSLHNDLHSASSGSDVDDDDIDDDIDDIDEEDNYMGNAFSSSSLSRRTVDDDDDCLLLTRGGSDDDDVEDEEDEEDDTCLSVIPESNHSHLVSFSVPPLPQNTTISSDLMTATELSQMSSMFKEDSSNEDDKKEEEVVGSTKDGGEESEPVSQTMSEESCHSQNGNVAHSLQKEGKSLTADSNGVSGDVVIDHDDDDDVCILSGEAAMMEGDYDCGDDTSDTACLLAS